MVKYDLVTGEPSYDGSPPMTEQDIVNNASLVPYNNVGGETYFYDPNQRLINLRQQQMEQNAGYMNNPDYNYQFNNFMNPPQPPGFQGYVGNPALRYMQSMGQQQPIIQQPQDYTYHVPGFNTGSKVLLPSDVENICAELQMQMMVELEKANAERIERQRGYYNSLGYNGNNYYGMPYINNFYQDPIIINKYKQKIEEIRSKAEESRTNLNKNLSRLCQNYIEGEVDEDRIEEIYSNREIIIPAQQIEYDRRLAFLESLEPIDTSQSYRDHNEKVSLEYAEIFKDTSDMNSFLRDCGSLIRINMIEEEDHRRRNMSNLYKQDGAYKMLIRQKILEKNNKENEGGISLPALGQQNNNQIPMGQSFPTLNQSAKLLDDGTLQISAPSWLGDKQYSVKNTMEDEYEVQKGKFIQSIMNNQGSGGDNKDGS